MLNTNDKDSKELNEYRANLKKYIKGSKETKTKTKTAKDLQNIFINSNIKHATIVVEEMLKDAQKNVNILSHNLDSELYATEDVIESFKSFLKKEDSVMNILIEKDIDEKTNGMMQEILSSNNLHIKKIKEDAFKLYKSNFITTDGKNYRFESDRKEYKAIVEFGADARVKDLNAFFKSLGKQSEIVS